MKNIADVQAGDTVWVHNNAGLMWEGKIVKVADNDEDVVFDNGRRTRFQRRPRPGVKAEHHLHFEDTEVLRVHWLGSGILFDPMQALYFVYSDEAACRKGAWSLRSRRDLHEKLKSAPIDTLLHIAELLGVPGPSVPE